MEKILEELGFGTLIQRFKEERIEPEIVLSMTDGELTRLGISTMGDRIRLRQICRAFKSTQTTDQPNLSSEGVESSSSSNSSAGPSSASNSGSSAGPSLAFIASERSRLFNPRHSRTASSRKRKATSGRTWTAQILCLANRKQSKIPNSIEKQILHNAGLGLKKIRFQASDNAQQVVDKIMSDEKADNGELIGFPQLRDKGGFELLRCLPNCRELKIIDCPWTVGNLKATLGSQSKIYARPIQRNLSTVSIQPDANIQVKEKCEGCQKEFTLNELRSHLFSCTAGLLSSDSSENEIDPNQIRQIQHSNSASQIDMDDNSERSETTTSVGILEQPMINANQQPIRSLQQPTGNSENSVNVDNEQSNMNAETSNSMFANQQINSESIIINSSIIPIEDDRHDGPLDLNELECLVDEVVEQFKNSDIVSNKEILRLLQSKVLQGRSLDIEREDACPEGETSYIYVDRDNLLETALDEIATIDNLFLTLCVQFYGEQAQDYGGPRREFFRLVLREIKEKYFDNGLRELLKDEYEIVGTIMGMSILQNGKLPQFISDDIIAAIFDMNSKLPCIENLRNGLKKVGVFQICSRVPSMQNVFRFNPSSVLTIRKLNALLAPQFSPTGSNRRRFEGAVYAVFCKYVREVAGGRRGDVTLAHILQFATSTDEEPLLGFVVAPSIRFQEVNQSFLPTANTCINAMTLPHASITIQLPSDEKLWEMYDDAFLNAYFGNV